jgi:hypothetical protein
VSAVRRYIRAMISEEMAEDGWYVLASLAREVECAARGDRYELRHSEPVGAGLWCLIFEVWP